ncbi:MFS transporter [Cryobacterium sp. TMS1-13-1]|uniref:MFS transporter n=1 Tax=Cryobacterium sp. TMS1-13-1 TaxID=1259220 RepID=UPI001069C3B0|nr:MFS transporter [Cryobacterium sp. TMS1-13-1]TFD24117.1 MFS transporter [Cryobacterium sp. TMS1-13-1]
MPLTPDGSTQLSSTRIRLALLALALGGFGIGATEFVAMGLLPNLAADLLPGLYAAAPDAANAQVGWLISAYALGVVVGAPTIAAAAARWPRKQLLLALLTAFTLGTIASALLPTFETVLVARFVAGLPHGAYFGIASLVAARLMGPGKRARGIAIVLSGLTISNVIGVPTITWIGQVSGWRIAYLVVAAIFALTFVAVAAFVPFQAGNPKATMRAELRAFSQLQVWITLSIGAIGFGGLFAVYTYVAPLVIDITGLTAAAVPLILVVIGLGMTVGNFAGGALADWSVRRTMYVSFAVLIAALVTLGLSAQSLSGLVIGMFFIGAAASALSPTIQARLMDVAHESQSLAAALNHSSLNVGNALGAALGGVAIAAGLGYLAPVWIGVALSALGVLLTLLTFSIDRRRRLLGQHVPYGTQLIPVVRKG